VGIARVVLVAAVYRVLAEQVGVRGEYRFALQASGLAQLLSRGRLVETNRPATGVCITCD